MGISKYAALAAMAGATVMASPSAATVYVAVRTVGASTATLSLTTDGTIGALKSGNILFFSVTVAGQGATETMTNPPGGTNAGIYVNDVIASATQLTFDFDRPGANRGLIISPDNQGSTPENSYWGFEGPDGGLVNLYSDEFIIFPGLPPVHAARTGVQVIASTETIVQGAVPEPATWAMMIAGFGMIGGSIRRRRAIVRLA